MIDKAQSNLADDLEDGGVDLDFQMDVEVEPASQTGIEVSELPEDEVEIVEPGAGAAAAQEEEEQQDTEVDRWRRVASEREFHAAQTEAKSIMEVAQAQAQAVKVQYDSAKVGIDTLDFRIERAQEAMVAAEEEGNTKAKLALDRSIRQMEQLKSELEAGRAQMATPEQIMGQARQRAEHLLNNARAPKGTQINESTRAMNPHAEKWAKENAWMADPGHKRAHEYVIATSEHLVKAGWNPNDPKFYGELSRRVNSSFPNLNSRSTQRQPMPKPGVRTPVAPARSASGGAKPGANRTHGAGQKYTWQPGDTAAMVRMKLNPADPKHKAYFVKSRMESNGRNAS